MDRSKIINKTMVKLGLKSIDFITEEVKNPQTMTPKEKKKINKELTAEGLDENTRFDKIDKGINIVNSVLADNGFELDEVTGSDRFRKDSDSTTFRIARKKHKDPQSPTPVKNAAVSFSWHLYSESKITDTVKKKQFGILAYIG